MSILRVATYNIHKGVQGLGPSRRLEIHNLAHAVEQFDADIVCLQEVRRHNRKLEKHFTRWPDLDQASYLTPDGYEAVYRTNAITRHGEHGNALLSRWPVLDSQHSDVSDHRFEQRGLLHVQLLVEGHRGARDRGAPGFDPCQPRAPGAAPGRVHRHASVPETAPLIVAGDFNDWGAQLLKPMADLDLRTFEGIRLPTYPSRLPLLHLDRIFVRGLRPVSAQVPHGRAWARMSDHLPLIAELEL